MAKTNKNDIQKGVGLHARRVIAYVVLIIISFFCLFWFYIMFINATRSNGQLQSGFTAIPSTNLLKNWNNLVHGTLPIWYGMFNSLIIAACSAVLCTYFSTMTAYAIHAYEFRMKRFIYPFILMIMMIPTQVTALGFNKDGTDGFLYSTHCSNDCFSGCILLHEAVHGECTSVIFD